MAQKIYYEPDNYIPESLRKKYELGEYDTETQEEAKKLEEEKRSVNNSIRDFVNK